MDLKKILPSNGPSINEVKKYIDKYSKEIILIKLGGSCLNTEELFNQFINDLSIIVKLGLNTVIVHGGGKSIGKKLKANNIESKWIEGLRVSDENSIKFIEEALNEINLKIVKDGGWHFSQLKSPKDIQLKLTNSEDHYEYKLTKRKLSDVEDIVKRKIIIYDHQAKSTDYKFSNEFKLKTLPIKEMPLFLQNNIDKYKEWFDFDK